MPRKYQSELGSRPYRNYSEENLQKALDAVKSGMSKKQASKTFKIPRSTLINKVLGRHVNDPGGQRVLSDDEEKTLTSTLASVANWGFPLTKDDIRSVVKKYLDRKGVTVFRFKDNYPGPDFVENFIKRNNLSVRTASNITTSRAKVSAEDVRKFFDNVKGVLNNCSPQNLYNYDETNVTDDPGSKKVLVPKGVRRVERVQSHSKQSISLMVCGNAAGDLLPPMVVYKAQNMYENWKSGGPPGTVYKNSVSGWFDMDLFEIWFMEVLVPHINKTRVNDTDEVVVIGDNLASHFSPRVSDYANQNNIYLTPFPPNATHLMQPLDVAVFAPMKRKWRSVLDSWKTEARVHTSIPKEQFPGLLTRLWNSVKETSSSNIISGFRACGLYPANPSEVLKRLPNEENEAESTGTGTERIGRTLDDSLVELLKDKRGYDKEVTKRKTRGKKVEPGKRIIFEEQENEQDTDDPEPSTSGGLATGKANERNISKKTRPVMPLRKSQRKTKSGLKGHHR